MDVAASYMKLFPHEKQEEVNGTQSSLVPSIANEESSTETDTSNGSLIPTLNSQIPSMAIKRQGDDGSALLSPFSPENWEIVSQDGSEGDGTDGDWTLV